MIYLDYQATTPLAPEVAAAMSPWIEEKFANPHSPYSEGREAAAAIEVARGKVDSAIGLDDGQCLFTGSATEAINWALKGTMGIPCLSASNRAGWPPCSLGFCPPDATTRHAFFMRTRS